MSQEFDNYTPEQLGRVIHSVFGTLRTSDLKALLEAEEHIGYCGMQLGLNAQVDANTKMCDAVAAAVENLSKFSREELSKKIDCAIHNKEYTI